MKSDGSTICDIARRAKVSHMTVSRALNPRPGRRLVRRSTCNRILRVARQLNYQPNLAARSLRVRRTHHIGFCLNKADFSLAVPFWNVLVTSMQAHLWKHGYRLGFHYFDAARVGPFEEFLKPHRFVDGIVVLGRNLSPAEIDAIRRSDMRAVSLYEKIEGLHSMDIDELALGRAAADYLHQRGHRRAAVLAQRLPTRRWNARIDGFLQRAAEIGLEVPENGRIFTDGSPQDILTGLMGRRLFEEFFSRGAPVRCLYVPSDYLAFGVVDAMEGRDFRLGKDFSVLSYDNLEGNGHAPWGTPRLSSFEAPLAEIGIQAAEALMGRGMDQGGHVVFQPRLVERNSVAHVSTESESGGGAANPAVLA